jgi:N-methylhydantoinase A
VADTELRWSADMRYRGQSYEIEVPVDAAWLVAGDAAALAAAFHPAHERVFSHSDPAGVVELAGVRVQALGRVRASAVPASAAPGGDRPVASAGGPSSPVAGGASALPVPGRRTARFAGVPHVAAVHQRTGLVPGVDLAGPAIVEQEDSTTVVPPGWRARIGLGETLVLEREGDAS